MTFNKTITFEAAERRDQLETLNLDGGEKLKTLHAKTLEVQSSDSAILGLSGVFIRTPTDFMNIDEDDSKETELRKKHYEDELSWPVGKRRRVKKFRFFICILALIGCAFALMSRIILNVSIVQMMKKPTLLDEEKAELLEFDPGRPGETVFNIEQELDVLTIDASLDIDSNQIHDDLHFIDNEYQKLLILSSFYWGLAPGLLIGGMVAERYGAKFTLFVALFSTSIVNLATPHIVKYSVYLLVVSRVILGSMQGCIFPSLYELFNRWLTSTETSVFTPLTRLIAPIGAIIGTLMPGILGHFGFAWPLLFYICGSLALAWSIAWFFIATSTPQTNRFVGQGELDRIMRKKGISIITTNEGQTRPNGTAAEPGEVPRTPWLKILFNRSVLAFTVVRFTYNMGADFVFIMLPSYLGSAFGASTQTISYIMCAGFLIQLVLLTFVAWLAKVVVSKRSFGLSVTKWRKVFQGIANICSALSFFALACSSRPSIELATVAMMFVNFFWIFGAGGEAMVPYDLSYRYPATIVGFGYSISLISSFGMPIACGYLVGPDTHIPSNWGAIFYTIAALQASGGIIFCLFLRSKPFLSEEREHYDKMEREREKKVQLDH